MRSKHVWLLVLVLAVPSAVSVTAFAAPVAFTLQEGGAVRFRCRGEGIRNPAEGRFSTVSSHLDLDPSDLSTVRGEVQVIMASITTESSGWDVMFRRAPFLEIEQFPRATFTVTGVEGATSLDSGRWTLLRILGDLTISGVTKAKSVEALVFWDAPTRRLRLRARTEMTWEEHDIAMPEGNTRSFAGDRAALLISLDFVAPAPPPEPPRRRR